MSNESQHQRALIKWARLSRQAHPELELLYAVPNGAHTSPRNKARLVDEGLVSGVSDLHLPVARGGFIGLWIEMKSEQGKLSPEQIKWLEAMSNNGHAVTVCRGWEPAKEVILEYLAGEKGTTV